MKIFHLPESRDRFFGHMIGLCPGKITWYSAHQPHPFTNLYPIYTIYHLHLLPPLLSPPLSFCSILCNFSSLPLAMYPLPNSTYPFYAFLCLVSFYYVHICPTLSFCILNLYFCFHLYFISYLLSKLFLIFPILYFSLLYLYSVPPGISSPILLFSYCSSVPATRSSAN